MEQVVEELKIKYKSPEWYALRTKGIGGSDAASVLGLSPWKKNTDLWKEKVGLVQSSFKTNKRMEEGSLAEDPIAQLFAIEHADEYEFVDYKDTVFKRGHRFASVDGGLIEKATGRKVEPLTIRMDKQIPVCAGTAGGSSDAAAVLRYLDRVMETHLSLEELQAIGETVGSDVPYCVMGGTALAEGRGERLTPLPPLPSCPVVLCKPNFPVSTPALFGQLDRCKLRRRPDTKGILAALEAGGTPWM